MLIGGEARGSSVFGGALQVGWWAGPVTSRFRVVTDLIDLEICQPLHRLAHVSLIVCA